MSGTIISVMIRLVPGCSSTYSIAFLPVFTAWMLPSSLRNSIASLAFNALGSIKTMRGAEPIMTAFSMGQIFGYRTWRQGKKNYTQAPPHGLPAPGKHTAKQKTKAHVRDVRIPRLVPRCAISRCSERVENGGTQISLRSKVVKTLLERKEFSYLYKTSSKIIQKMPRKK